MRIKSKHPEGKEVIPREGRMVKGGVSNFIKEGQKVEHSGTRLVCSVEKYGFRRDERRCFLLSFQAQQLERPHRISCVETGKQGVVGAAF